MDIRLRSSSGGFFSWLSDFVLENNGVVYGALYDEKLFVVHGRAETKNERDKMCGSKYVQSFIGDAFKNVKNDLLAGKKVLFTGTPCQCEAVLEYLGAGFDTSNLITMDFICEGVASPLVFEKYKKYESRKYKRLGQLEYVNFRDKNRYNYRHKPILARRLVLGFLNKSTGVSKLVYDGLGNSRYLDSMFSGLLQRDACIDCKFHTYDRASDFTCGDFHRYHGSSDFKDEYGISEVLANTEKAKAIIAKHINENEFLRCNKEDVWQPLLTGHIDVDCRKRNAFWKTYQKSGYKKATGLVMGKVYKRYAFHFLRTIKIKMKKYI